MLTEKWGQAEELAALQIELASVARTEFLRANGARSASKPIKIPRPWSKQTNRVKPTELLARLKGAPRG